MRFGRHAVSVKLCALALPISSAISLSPARDPNSVDQPHGEIRATAYGSARMLVRINLEADTTHRRVPLLRVWKKIQVGPSDQSLRQRSPNDTGQIEKNGERFVRRCRAEST